MMRRLGMWSRLGIVVTVLWMLIAPLAFTVREHARWDDMQDTWRRYCVKTVADKPAEEMAAANKACWDEWSGDRKANRGPIYRNALFGAAALAAVAWLLISGTALVARWVWRGRQLK